ncbi:MAG: hypothetical protein JOZ23_08560 [Mycobacterium sp.]|nr:hypothetical protein [Mycobacterium sp.]
MAERRTENQEPQRRLHHPGDQFGAVVLKLLQFDDRESSYAQQCSADTAPSLRRAYQIRSGNALN